MFKAYYSCAPTRHSGIETRELRQGLVVAMIWALQYRLPDVSSVRGTALSVREASMLESGGRVLTGRGSGGAKISLAPRYPHVRSPSGHLSFRRPSPGSGPGQAGAAFLQTEPVAPPPGFRRRGPAGLQRLPCLQGRGPGLSVFREGAGEFLPAAAGNGARRIEGVARPLAAVRAGDWGVGHIPIKTLRTEGE